MCTHLVKYSLKLAQWTFKRQIGTTLRLMFNPIKVNILAFAQLARKCQSHESHVFCTVECAIDKGSAAAGTPNILMILKAISTEHFLTSLASFREVG